MSRKSPGRITSVVGAAVIPNSLSKGPDRRAGQVTSPPRNLDIEPECSYRKEIQVGAMRAMSLCSEIALEGVYDLSTRSQ